MLAGRRAVPVGASRPVAAALLSRRATTAKATAKKATAKKATAKKATAKKATAKKATAKKATAKKATAKKTTAKKATAKKATAKKTTRARRRADPQVAGRARSGLVPRFARTRWLSHRAPRSCPVDWTESMT